jgi:hypothetical protein
MSAFLGSKIPQRDYCLQTRMRLLEIFELATENEPRSRQIFAAALLHIQIKDERNSLSNPTYCLHDKEESPGMALITLPHSEGPTFNELVSMFSRTGLSDARYIYERRRLHL